MFKAGCPVRLHKLYPRFFVEEGVFFTNAARIAELCEKAGTKVLMIETWAEKKYPEHQDLLSEANRKVADSISAQLVPVGSIWKRILADYPDIELFWKDGEHAGMYGDYVIAAVLSRMVINDRKSKMDSLVKDPVKEFVGALEVSRGKPQVL